MPERTPYDEAMMLSQARLKVQDTDLKYGQVETISIQTSAGAIERPWGVQGGFAVVYKFRTQSGRMKALRCFLVQMDLDMQFRYERISAYFAAHASDITAEFRYYDSGIILKENVQGQLQRKVYPLIEMEWIEGMTLVEYVDELCRKRDLAGLADVIDQWVTILRTLRQARISHGDLAGVNVMVRPNGRLVLVDYDGVYIPDFVNLSQILLGQPDYQHPQMDQRPFNEQTDDFSALVIYTALLALHAKPELWNKYMRRGSQIIPLETNLLFLQQDFIDPERSSLFADLEQLSDTRIRAAVQALKHICKQPIAQIVLDWTLLDTDFKKQQALIQLELVIHQDDDQEIVKAWVPALLDNYGPAQQYIARVGHARQVVQALKTFLDALQTQSMQQIIAAYDPILNNCSKFTVEQQDQLLYAFNFTQAYYAEDDQEMVNAWEVIQDSYHRGGFVLTVPEQQRLALAKERKKALVKFRLAVINKNIQQIVGSYDSLLDTCIGVTSQERDLLLAAQDFVQAYQIDDDQAIIAASDEIENFSYREHVKFTAQEQQRITLARQRKMALMKFRLGLISKNVQQIIANYDWILDDCKGVTKQERDILQMAKNLMQAYHNGSDEAIAAAWECIQKTPYQKFFILPVQDQQRITIIQQHKAILAQFRYTLTSKHVRLIVENYDSALDHVTAITHEERNLLQVARNFVQAYQSDNDQAIASAWEEIQDSHYQQSLILIEEEQQRIALAQQRKSALLKFRLAMINNRNIQQIVTAYDSVLDDCNNVTQDEHEQLDLARRFIQAYQSDNDQAILSVWSVIQNSLYKKSFVLTPTESQRVALAQTRNMSQGGFPHA